MKSKPDFDPDRPVPSRRRLWPIRSIGQLMVVVAVSGLLLAIGVTTARQPLSSIVYWEPGLSPSSTARPRLALYPAPDVTPAALVREVYCGLLPDQTASPPDTAPQPLVTDVQLRDRMVVIAPESIDPAMVVRAPAWIDPKMVFTPRGYEQPEQGVLPAPGLPWIAPRSKPQSRLVPVPDRSAPRAKDPRFERVPVPEGSLPPAKKPAQ